MCTADLAKEIFSKLYDTFSHYPKPGRVIGSPISVREGDDLPLLIKPLKSLSIDDFGRYPFKAMSTWGTVEDFKYFLPRILELSFYSFNLLNSDTFFNKILSAGWRDWSEDEKNVFKEYLLAMWNHATQWPYHNLQKIETLAGNLNYFIDDINYLIHTWAKKWIEDENEAHFEELVSYMDSNWVAIFFEYKPHHVFLDAILESSLSARLENSFFKYEKCRPDFADQISRCEQKLSYYLSNR